MPEARSRLAPSSEEPALRFDPVTATEPAPLETKQNVFTVSGLNVYYGDFRAVRAVVHQGASVEDAHRIYLEEKEQAHAGGGVLQQP